MSTIDVLDVQLDPALARRAAVRAALVRDFHIEAAFVGVPKLSRILGLAPSTIYAHVRAGCFFIQPRMMNTMTMFLLDDVVEWMCRESAPAQPTPITPSPIPQARQEDYTSTVVAEALRDMGPSHRSRRALTGGRA